MNETPSKGDAVTQVTPPSRHRVSWGAIWAGMFVTAIMLLMCILLGVACGISTLNPFYHSPSAPTGLSVGAYIWLIISWLVSVWVGSCVAGWLSGGPRRSDGTIHGVVVWSFASAVILLLATGAVGRVLGGGPEGVVVMAPVNNAGLASQGQPPQEQLAPTGRTGPQQPNQSSQLQSPGSPSGASVSSGPHYWGVALWSFLALILGLAAAAWGGSNGVASSEHSRARSSA